MQLADDILPLIALDRSSELPLYAQIARALEALIRRGSLGPGVKLPSSRQLAEAVGVHRKTVVQAFSVLESAGLVSSGVGQGTFVRSVGAFESGASPAGPGAAALSVAQSDAAGSETGNPGTGEPFWSRRLSPASRRAQQRNEPWMPRPLPEGAIRLSGGTADPAFFPTEEVRQAIDGALSRHGARCLDYASPEGLLELREWIADGLRLRGVRVEPDQIVIVNGSQQGLDLVTRLLLEPGSSVFVEEPGYRNGFRMFQAAGCRVTGVTVDHDGLVPEELDRLAAQGAPRLLYTIPAFQNPTGMCLSVDRAARLLECAHRHAFPVLEDQFTADLAYEGDTPVPLLALDRGAQVIQLGTFSKILFPGFRLGWLVLPRDLIGPARELKQTMDLSSSLLTQYAMNDFCRAGALDRHLRTIREINSERLRVALDAMTREFPEGASWTVPRGGLNLWVRLPNEVDAVRLGDLARRQGVGVAPGPAFFPGGGGTGFLRLTFVREPEDRLREGLRILGALMRDDAALRLPSGVGPFL